MGASVRSTSTYASTASEASSTVPLPTGWQPGDVCYIGTELTAASGTITVPTGWVEVVPQFHSSASTSATHNVMRRVLQSGDTGPAISHTSGRFAADILAIEGADNTTPEDVTPTTDTNSGTSYPNVEAPSITPLASNCLLLTFHAVRNATNGATTSFTPDAAETEKADVTTAVAGSSNAAIEAATQTLTSNAATGTRTATAASSSGTSISAMGSAIAIRSVVTVSPVGTPATPAQNTSGAPVTGSWSGTQPRTSGDLLVAVVTAAGGGGAGATSQNTGTTGWAKAAEATEADAVTAIWTKTATGSDAAPGFTSSIAGSHQLMSCTLYELSASDGSTPVLDTSGTGTGTATAGTVTATTSGNVTATGEYAIGLVAQGNSIATSSPAPWGAGGGAWVSAFTDGTTNWWHWEVSTLSSPGSGGTLSFTPTWSAGGVTNQIAAVVAVFKPGTASGSTVSLTVAQETIAAPAPSAQLTLALPVAQETISAPAPSLQEQLSLPVAGVNVNAVAPSLQVRLSLPVAQANIGALSPALQVQLGLPVARVNVNALASTLAVRLGLPVAQASISAPAPTVSVGGGPQTVNLAAAQVTVGALAPSPRISVGLPVAQVAVAAPAPPLQALLSLPTAQVATASLPGAPRLALTLAVAQVSIRALPPTISTLGAARVITVEAALGQPGVHAALQPGKWSATIA